MIGLGVGHLAWSTSAPAWPTWSSRGPICGAAVGIAPGGRPAAAARAASPSPGRSLLERGLGRRLGDHHRRRRAGRRAVHRLRLQRRHRRHRPHRRPAHPRQPTAHGEPRHDPPRRLRHRPGRPPRRRAARRPRRRRGRRQPQRTGRASPEPRVVGGDATDPAFTTRVAAGADVVYFCLNAMNYARWAEEFPPLQRAVLAGAAGRRRSPGRARQPLRLRAHPAAVTSSRPSRPGRPRPRPRPGPP